MSNTALAEVPANVKKIVRWVRVRTDRTGHDALVATGRKIVRTDANVVEAMPRPARQWVKVVLFTTDQDVSNKKLAQLYASHRLKPVDPYTLASLNEADRAFADTYWNATVWKNADGEICIAIFNGFGPTERHVCIRLGGDGGWHRSWWYAGIDIE